MDIFLELIIFIMGTFFGSFFTLAVYRIPLKKDITHEHSFCPNCNHKLNFLDLIPIFSYIFLKGKCRYCGEKVRIRYLILEVLSGLVFVLAYISLDIQNAFLDINKLMCFISFVFMYVTLVIIAGIDKEYRKIHKSVLLFGVICEIVYILYLYIVENANIYRYSIYLAIFIVLFILNIITQKDKNPYWLQILLLCSYIIFILDISLIMPIIILSIIIMISLYFINKDKYNAIAKIPFGFVISFSAIVCEIAENFIQSYFI